VMNFSRRHMFIIPICVPYHLSMPSFVTAKPAFSLSRLVGQPWLAAFPAGFVGLCQRSHARGTGNYPVHSLRACDHVSKKILLRSLYDFAATLSVIFGWSLRASSTTDLTSDRFSGFFDYCPAACHVLVGGLQIARREGERRTEAVMVAISKDGSLCPRVTRKPRPKSFRNTLTAALRSSCREVWGV
jgi:hypothetical protein